MTLLLTVFVVFVLLGLSEVWWRATKVHTEITRKFAHITVGSFVAFWPFFLNWTEIELLSVSFLVVVSISRYLHILQAIHSVQRPTWGELFFAIAVGGTALITHNKWIYLAALLQMGLADGLAAVMGVRYGARHRYLIFKQAKSLIGTATFALTSALILLAYNYYSGSQLSLLILSGTVVGATLVENFGVMGLDNLLVPLLMALLLRSVS